MNEWVLDPLSIATSGYIGHGPTMGDYCPLPLAIASHGYIRFDVTPPFPPGGAGFGKGYIEYVAPRKEQNEKELETLAIFAVMIIDDDTEYH